MIIQNNEKHFSLKKILYPAMALAMLMPFAGSAVQPITANARRRPRVVRRVRNRNRRRINAPRSNNNGKTILIYAAYQRNSNGKGGHYVIKNVTVKNSSIKGNNRNTILNGWKDTRQNRINLARKVAQKNKLVRKQQGAPKDASYLVPNNQILADGSQSTNYGAKRNIHKGILPIRIKSRTTLWDIARANLKHYNYHTYRRDVNRSAKALLSMNPKIKNIHRTMRKGTILYVPTNQAKRLKTSFSVWTEFIAGLSKSEIRAKRWIAMKESTDRYHVWASGQRHGGKTPYGKYQLERKYLRTDNGHSWNSPYTQEDFANQYAYHRYHSWNKAVNFHKRHNYY